jgi:hypothetical protein
VRSVRQIVYRKNQGFRKAPALLLVLICILRNLLNDFAITVRRRDSMLDGGRIKRAFVFEIIERFDASVRVDLADLLAFFEEYSINSHVRMDNNRVVIDQPIIENCLLDTVAKHGVTEHSNGVRSWCRG